MEKIPEDQGDELSQSEEDRDGTRDERFSDFSDPPRLAGLGLGYLHLKLDSIFVLRCFKPP
jgi:hypothetical protein